MKADDSYPAGGDYSVAAPEVGFEEVVIDARFWPSNRSQ
jgi:hypothetical protein